VKTRLSRWGNSMAVRISKEVADAAGLRSGDQLELAVEGLGVVKIRKKKSAPKLAQLLHGVTPQNLHTEDDWGAPVGKELW
jgi:antitoxin MazE